MDEVSPELNPDQAADVFDANGKLVFPGLVDTHVHLTHTRQAVGFQMLARAGVTCALDCGGFVGDVITGMADAGSGISVAVLNRLDPGVSISGPDTPKNELAEYLEKSLEQGALGLKLLGGHLPLSPETTSAAIEIVNQAVLTVANGKIIMIDGLVTGSGGTMITTESGMKVLQAKGVQAEAADLAGGLFYNAPGN